MLHEGIILNCHINVCFIREVYSTVAKQGRNNVMRFWLKPPATGSEFCWITLSCIHTPSAKHIRAINAKVTVWVWYWVEVLPGVSLSLSILIYTSYCQKRISSLLKHLVYLTNYSVNQHSISSQNFAAIVIMIFFHPVSGVLFTLPLSGQKPWICHLMSCPVF